MSRVKQASQRSKAIPILGAAGLSLTLTSGVSAAVGPTPNTPARNVAVSQEITLREDEISDVSLATFHVFDNENQAGKRLACGCGGGCCLFARAPASPLGDEVYSTQPHRPDGRTNMFRSNTRCADVAGASVRERVGQRRASEERWRPS
jgi:hypothetical protein